MKDAAKRISALKDKIEEAKNKKARLEGRLESAMSDLKKEFGIKSLKEAKVTLEKWRKDLGIQEKELEEKLDEIEEKFGW